MKADDKRFIHRSSITGEIVSEDYALANPDTTEKEEVTDYSPWLKEWMRIGQLMEAYSGPRSDMLNTLTVDAVIHAQVLKGG